MAEIIIKSQKEKEEINFAEVIKNYWKNNQDPIELDEIILIDKIN